MQVQTDPPTVCAIAYGRTGSLGSIADDPSMGGTAISHHTVRLSGLTPSTTYRFRLTATDAQGRVFQTRKLTTFTTTPSTAAAPGGDIAAGATIVAVSSGWSTGYQAANAVEATSRPSGPRPATATTRTSPSTSDNDGRSAASPFAHARCRTAQRSPARIAVVVDGDKRYGTSRRQPPAPANRDRHRHRPPPALPGRALHRWQHRRAEIRFSRRLTSRADHPFAPLAGEEVDAADETHPVRPSRAGSAESA